MSTTPLPDRSKIEYSERRRARDKALSYESKYEEKFHKRISDRREKRLLDRLLRRTGRNSRLLDLPCGAGRLSEVISRYADQLYEVDYSAEMLRLCRKNAVGRRPYLASATAFQLPFADNTFDLVVSVRLSHHIPGRERRLMHLHELMRVSKEYVLVSFFDTHSVKNRLRNLQRACGRKKREKFTLSRTEVEAAAAAHGFGIAEARQLSWMFSGHTFTLLRRETA